MNTSPSPIEHSNTKTRMVKNNQFNQFMTISENTPPIINQIRPDVMVKRNAKNKNIMKNTLIQFSKEAMTINSDSLKIEKRQSN